MKRVVRLAAFAAAAITTGGLAARALSSWSVEHEFPYTRPYYLNRDPQEIRSGDQLVILRNPGSDLYLDLGGEKEWDCHAPLKIQLSTESKEIGSETFHWHYWRKSFRLQARSMDPDSFVKITFQTKDPGPLHLTKFEARTNRRYPKVLILGLDGATLEILQPLIQQRKLPNFKKLTEEYSYGTLLSEEPAYSPVIWTTLASGRTPQDHGITFYLSQREPELSNSIKVKRFWNIFSQYSKLNSVLLGWYLTWPVEDLQGAIISDRAYYNFKTKDLSFPPGVFDSDFQKHFIRISNSVDKSLSRFTSFPYYWDWRSRYPRGTNEYVDSKIVHQRLAHVYRRDAAYAEYGLKIIKTMSPDIVAVYLRGLDFTSHGFWKFRHPDQVPFLPVTEKEKKVFHDVIDNYYIYLDEVLGNYIAALDKDATVFILSDHGFHAISPEEGTNPELSGAHDLNGVLFCKGPHFKRGYKITKASIYDFLPTLLYVTGLPQAEDMPGHVLTDAIRAEFIAKNPIKKIKTYGARTGSTQKSPGALDEEIKDELRSLGYIQ